MGIKNKEDIKLTIDTVEMGMWQLVITVVWFIKYGCSLVIKN